MAKYRQVRNTTARSAGDFVHRKYRVIRNDCRSCNNLPYTINLRQEYVVALMDLEVYVPPLPASILEMKVRIRTAIETITADMLQTA